MIESLEKLKSYDLIELNKSHDDLELCLARIINTLDILEKRQDTIVNEFGGWKDNDEHI